MPPWKIHVKWGITAVISSGMLFITLLYKSSNLNPILVDDISLFSSLGILLSIALVVGIIFGSVLPDIDGGGKILYYLSPFFGFYTIFLFLTSIFLAENDFILHFNSYFGITLLFTCSTILSYILIIIPKKHRGSLHQPYFTLIYGFLWASFHRIFWPINGMEMFLLFVGAVFGYSTHLLLDWTEGIAKKLKKF